ILFAAVIALDTEAAFEGRARRDGVGLGKRDPMPEEKVLPKMKPMVLAEHHPTVVAIDPHFFPFLSFPLSPAWFRWKPPEAPQPRYLCRREDLRPKEERLCWREPSSLLSMFSDAEGRPRGPS